VLITSFAARARLASSLVLILVLLAQDSIGQSPEPARQIPEALNFANGLYRNRRYDLAAEEYEKFLGANPPKAVLDQADAWFGLGNARLFLGKYKEARQAFEEFVKVAPNHPNAPTARYRVGETAYVLSDLPAARQALEEYVGANSGDRRYLQAAWSHLGDVDYRLGDLSAARKAYESALVGSPQGSLPNKARLGLGRVLAAQTETEPALTVLRELAAKGGPEWSDKAWLEVGKIESARDRWQEAADALEALEKATPRSPLVAEARIERAEAMGKLGRPEEAEALLRTVADDPAQRLAAQAADALGSSLLARGKAAEALASLDQATVKLAASPSLPLLRYHAAEALLALGKLNDARERFFKLANDDPTAPTADDAMLRAAAMTLDAKQPAPARTIIATFTAKFPNSPLRGDARLIDARAAIALGQPKDAISTLEKSLVEDKVAPAVVQATYYYLGLAYQKDGQPEKAAEVLAKLAQSPSPVAANAQYLLGQTDFDAGRFEPSIVALEKYLADNPKGEVADHALARISQAQIELNRLDEASATLARLTEAFPKSPTLAPTRFRLAEAALNAKQFDRAIGLFKLASESPDPAQQARARSGLGWSLLGAGQPAEAAATFGALLEATPDDPLAPEAALTRAYALDQARQPEAALLAYASAVEKYPKSPQAGPASLALARLQVEAKKPDDASKTFALIARDYASTSGEPLDAILSEWGWTLIDAAKPAEADAIFDRLLKEFPDSPKAADSRYNLAVSAFGARDFDRVLDLLKPLVAEGSTARPQLTRPALNLYGRTQAERADWTGAAATFARLIAEDTEGTFRREARFWKAEVAFKSEDAKSAEPEFAALAAEPPVETDFKGLASTAKARRVQCLAQLGRWDETITAADAFKTADLADPLAPEVDYARGRACQGLARFDEAREAFDRVIAARKGSELAAKAQLMRGETYFHQQNYKDALRDYYRVIIQYNAPESQAIAYLEAGKVHEKLDQWKEAVDNYEKLRARFPKDKYAEEAGKRLEVARARIARPGGADESRTR
jgi:cellulose synthase operon protein C